MSSDSTYYLLSRCSENLSETPLWFSIRIRSNVWESFPSPDISICLWSTAALPHVVLLFSTSYDLVFICFPKHTISQDRCMLPFRGWILGFPLGLFPYFGGIHLQIFLEKNQGGLFEICFQKLTFKGDDPWLGSHLLHMLFLYLLVSFPFSLSAILPYFLYKHEDFYPIFSYLGPVCCPSLFLFYFLKFFSNLFIGVFFLQFWDRTQGLTHAKRVYYHWAICPVSFSFLLLLLFLVSSNSKSFSLFNGFFFSIPVPLFILYLIWNLLVFFAFH